MTSVLWCTNLGHLNCIREKVAHSDILVYLDDLIFQKSLLLEASSVELHKFLNYSGNIHIGTKKTEKVVTKAGKKNALVSKKGNYFYNEDDYNSYKARFPKTNFFEYEAKKLVVNGLEFYEPDSLDDFCENITNKTELCLGTTFFDNLVNGGYLIQKEGGKLTKKHINDCSALEYMRECYNRNEINASIFIAEENYKLVRDYINENIQSE